MTEMELCVSFVVYFLMKKGKGQITVMHGVRDYKFNNIYDGKEGESYIQECRTIEKEY